MSCQCYQIGGPFIAEDPDCPVHGMAAQREALFRQQLIVQLDEALDSEEPERIEDAARNVLSYLRTL